MNKGAVLYRDIVDHKTPLIYFLAQVHTQLNFRILLMLWMLVSTGFFYSIAKKIFNRRSLATVSTFIFVLLTTLPWLEGNIPNGELFVIGFVLVGGWLLFESRLGKILTVSQNTSKLRKKDLVLLVTAGGFFGLGILTKVPALFDLVGFGALALISLSDQIKFNQKRSTTIANFLKSLQLRAIDYGLVFGGTAFVILASVMYFSAKGALPEYLEFGLLYNFRYAGTWQLPFEQQWLQFAFSLPGKFLITFVLVLAPLLTRNYLSKALQFSIIWFSLSLFASLLSNRPYPHYFIQVVPPLSLLVVAGYQQFISAIQKKSIQKAVAVILSVKIPIALLLAVILLIGVRPYPAKEYYQNWFDVATKKITPQEYNSRFNYIMTENYQVTSYLDEVGADRTFIWGTNPMLYAQSDTWPATRFTVAFHIEDLKVFDQTLSEIQKVRPGYIITMDRETIAFPMFFGYLYDNYVRVFQTEHMTVWKDKTGFNK
jgi:hypothetical protein